MKPYSQSLAKYIPEQYKQSARLRGVIEAVQGQFDDLEDAFMEIYQALDPREAIGVALDYIGAIVGVDREPAEDDESYRVRITTRSFLDAGLTAPEAVRAIIKYITGTRSVCLFPDWPAAMYYVIDGGTSADLSALENEIMTSGASLTRGTFLVGELEGEGYEFGYIVDEDHGMPIVCDYRWPDTEYAMVDDEDYLIVDDEDNVVVGIDYLTTSESFEPT
jgi:hypothetical protein